MGLPLSDISNQLNQQQQDMLRLFKNPMPQEDYVQMKRLAVSLLSKHLDKTVEDWEKENNIGPEHYTTLAQQHLRKNHPKK